MRFLTSLSLAEKLGTSDKKKFFTYQPCFNFYIQTKLRLKNRVITMHLLQCKPSILLWEKSTANK